MDILTSRLMYANNDFRKTFLTLQRIFTTAVTVKLSFIRFPVDVATPTLTT